MKAGQAFNRCWARFVPRDKGCNQFSLWYVSNVVDTICIFQVQLQDVKKPQILKTIEHTMGVVMLQHVLMEKHVDLFHVILDSLICHRHPFHDVVSVLLSVFCYKSHVHSLKSKGGEKKQTGENNLNINQYASLTTDDFKP